MCQLLQRLLVGQRHLALKAEIHFHCKCKSNYFITIQAILALFSLALFVYESQEPARCVFTRAFVKTATSKKQNKKRRRKKRDTKRIN